MLPVNEGPLHPPPSTGWHGTWTAPFRHGILYQRRLQPMLHTTTARMNTRAARCPHMPYGMLQDDLPGKAVGTWTDYLDDLRQYNVFGTGYAWCVLRARPHAPPRTPMHACMPGAPARVMRLRRRLVEATCGASHRM